MAMVKQLVGVVVMAGLLAMGVPSVEASTLSEELAVRRAERRARLEEKKAAFEERMAELRGETGTGEAPVVLPDSEPIPGPNAGEDDAEPCRCTVRLGYAKPQLQFSNGTLTFVPRVDVNVRSRGDFTAPGWTAVLNYSGSSAYTSDDVSVPDGVSFSGSQNLFSGACGTNYNFKGLQLPAVPLTGLVQGLIGLDEELRGTVRMDAELLACDKSDSERRQFPFRWQDLVNLRVSGWRIAR